MSKTQLQDLVDRGHEMMNHTKTHVSLTSLDDTELTDEIGGAKQWLIDNLAGVDQVRSFTSPFAHYSQAVLNKIAQYHECCTGPLGIYNYQDTPDLELYYCDAGAKSPGVLRGYIDTAIANKS